MTRTANQTLPRSAANNNHAPRTIKEPIASNLISPDAETMLSLARGNLDERTARIVIHLASRECIDSQEAADLGFLVQSSGVRAPNPFTLRIQARFNRAYTTGRIAYLQNFSAHQYVLPKVPVPTTKRLADHLKAIMGRLEVARYPITLMPIYAVITARVLHSNAAQADPQNDRPASYSQSYRKQLSALVVRAVSPWSCVVTVPCDDMAASFNDFGADGNGDGGEQLPLPFPAPHIPTLTLASE